MKAQKKLVPHQPADRVFPHAGDYCRYWFKACLKAAKIDDYTWHCNRHTFCSWLAMAGVPMKAIQELAGHQSIATTARYMHLAPEVTEAASERMVGPPLSKQQAPKQAPGVGTKTRGSRILPRK